MLLAPSNPLPTSLWALSAPGTPWWVGGVTSQHNVPNFLASFCRNQVALRLAYIGDEMDLCLRSPRLAQLPGIAMHR